VPEDKLINLGGEGLTRPVRFVARKSTYSIPIVANFYQFLMQEVPNGDFTFGAEAN